MPDSPQPDESSDVRATDRQDALVLAARRHPLVAHVDRQLRHRCGLRAEGDGLGRLVLGVSGGADSTALLLAVAAIQQHGSNEGRLEPVAIHVHHHLRDSADDDETWIVDLCRRLGVTVHVEHVDPAACSGNVSANARRLRYEALANRARMIGSTHIAVAHHGDDQLETVLMALGRGAGLEGLAGMPWRRELEPGLWLVRPLLDSRRADCENLCRSAGIEWREDPGNLDPNSTRARVRHEIAPVMEALWPDAARRVTAASDLMEATRLTLQRQLHDVFGDATERQWVRQELAGLPTAILAAGLRRAAVDASPEAGDDLGQKHLLQAAQAIQDEQRRPREFDWPGGLRLIVTSKSVVLKPTP